MEELTRKLILLKDAIVRKARKDESFRRALLEDPRTALKHATGKDVPQGVEIRVYQDTRDVLHIALPLDMNPPSRDVAPLAEESQDPYGEHSDDFPDGMTRELGQ